MKKLIGIVPLLCCMAVLSAKTHDVHMGTSAGYTHYFLRTQLYPAASNSSALWAQMKTGAVDEHVHAPGFVFDLRLHYFYTMMNIVFPSKDFAVVLQNGTPTAALHKPGSYILDCQTGGGYTFFKKRPVNIFIGGAIALTARENKTRVLNTEYVRSDILVGSGINALLSVYPLSFFGLYVGVSDTVYFLPLKTMRKLGGIELKNEAVKNVLANSFNVRAGLIFRF